MRGNEIPNPQELNSKIRCSVVTRPHDTPMRVPVEGTGRGYDWFNVNPFLWPSLLALGAILSCAASDNRCAPRVNCRCRHIFRTICHLAVPRARTRAPGRAFHVARAYQSMLTFLHLPSIACCLVLSSKSTTTTSALSTPLGKYQHARGSAYRPVYACSGGKSASTFSKRWQVS